MLPFQGLTVSKPVLFVRLKTGVRLIIHFSVVKQGSSG